MKTETFDSLPSSECNLPDSFSGWVIFVAAALTIITSLWQWYSSPKLPVVVALKESSDRIVFRIPTIPRGRSWELLGVCPFRPIPEINRLEIDPNSVFRVRQARKVGQNQYYRFDHPVRGSVLYEGLMVFQSALNRHPRFMCVVRPVDPRGARRVVLSRPE